MDAVPRRYSLSEPRKAHEATPAAEHLDTDSELVLHCPRGAEREFDS